MPLMIRMRKTAALPVLFLALSIKLYFPEFGKIFFLNRRRLLEVFRIGSQKKVFEPKIIPIEILEPFHLLCSGGLSGDETTCNQPISLSSFLIDQSNNYSSDSLPSLTRSNTSSVSKNSARRYFGFSTSFPSP